MPSFKAPSFQERAALAAKAKAEALEKLRSKPPLDDRTKAERIAASEKRQAAQAEKAAAKKAAKQAEAEAAAAALAKSAPPPPLTEAELKARRDARYAARKNRK
ncbi:MAG TPA: DUF6481 family protein [Sphingomicrobium sp.]|nr:DUF6481 family protein [Sphingomicrobium sp.]